MNNKFTGTITGKGISFGGSLIRTEATGYGLVYFAKHMLEAHNDTLEGKKVLISGSGNVAIYAAERLMQFGAKVVSLSDSGGTIYDADGLNAEKLEFVKDLKEVRRGRIKEYADTFGCEYHDGKTPWHIPADLALPCATQNELNEDDARILVKNGVKLVAEGANMPCTNDAAVVFKKSGTLYAPGKASNAGESPFLV